jgi:tetratricopeptide (TPR) repeat protein
MGTRLDTGGGEVVSGRIRVALSAAVAVSLVLLCAWGASCGDPLDQAAEFESAGDWMSALNVYERFLEQKPDDLPALSGAAVALTMLRRYDDALGLQERVIAADPHDAQTRVELGFNYLSHQDRPVDAVRVLREAVELESSAKHLTFLAQAQAGAGDLQGSEQSLRRAIAVDPAYGYAYRQLAELLAEDGRVDEATRLIEDARARGVDVVDTQ